MTREILLILVFVCPEVCGQPGSDVWLFDIRKKRDGITLENGRNITARAGYDNQPFFHPEKPLVYYVSADAEGETDIFEYNFKTGDQRQLTDTPEREYSPTVTPDRKFISCIVQRSDGAQDLCKYPIAGGAPQVLLDNLLVGYHAWADNHHVALFVLPEPFTLHLVNVDSRADTIVAQEIGRSLHKIPGKRGISFVQKEQDGWSVRMLDVATSRVSDIAKSISTSGHDMAWTQNTIVMSDGTRLFYCSPNVNSNIWKEIRFTDHVPTQAVSRVAVEPRGKVMAIVVSEE